MKRPSQLAAQIVAAVLAGAALGTLAHEIAGTAERAAAFSSVFSLATELFLRLIKMIIAPLVLATLVSGIVRAGRGSSLGRMGLQAMALFTIASFASLAIGIGAVALLKPGVGLEPPSADTTAGFQASATSFDLHSFLLHLIPRSLFEALANNEVLQIVVFALFAGIALAALGERGAPLARGAEALVALMLKITGYVMKLAPLAAFAAIAASVTKSGPMVLVGFGRLIGSFYLTLLVLWLVLLGAAHAWLGRRATLELARQVREPVLIGFATASSEAAYPATLERLERLGVPEHVASFVLPLGYSFNLVGSMMYCAFALLFIAQTFAIPLSLAQQLGMLMLLMVTSKGLAGVPRASLVIVAAALPHFHLPEQGLVLLLGVDQFLDMGRTATNVFGNSLAAAMVAKWQVKTP